MVAPIRLEPGQKLELDWSGIKSIATILTVALVSFWLGVFVGWIIFT